MRSEELADALELLADGPPWDTAWLRSLLPELAVRGRLVAQEEGEEEDQGLAISGVKEVESQMSAAERRKFPPLSEALVTEDGLPSAWLSLPLRFGVVLMRNGLSVKQRNAEPGQMISRIETIASGVIDLSRVGYAHLDANQKEKYLLRSGDILFSHINSPLHVGKSAVWSGESELYHGMNLMMLRPAPYLQSRWLSVFLVHLWRSGYWKTKCKQAVNQASVNQGDIGSVYFPLPPLAEQHRIVAKVDELMEHAAVVEERHLAATSARVRLRDAALHALAEAEDHEAVETAWSRIEEHFDDLFTEPEDIQPLRQTILQLAVRGRLVAQEEGPAAQSIRASVSVIGGSTPSKSRADYWDGSIPWVSPKDMKVSVIEDSQDHITHLALEERTQKTVPEGSVLIVIRGMILAHSFPVAVTAREVTINQDMKALVPDQCVVPKWLALALRGSKFEVLSRVERSTHGTCKLALAEVLDLSVSVPPLAEQHRMVAKVDELMALCDTLESSLTRAKATREQFAGSISHALAESH